MGARHNKNTSFGEPCLTQRGKYSPTPRMLFLCEFDLVKPMTAQGISAEALVATAHDSKDETPSCVTASANSENTPAAAMSRASVECRPIESNQTQC